MNKNLVLNSIRTNAPLSRAQVSISTGLNKGTVSSLVAELVNEDLIYEIGPGQSSGGRRPVLLMFQNRSGNAIGIDIGVNYLLGTLTDLSGSILNKIEISTDNTDVDNILNLLQKLITDLTNLASNTTYGVVGIGIGVPGIVNENGKVLFAPNLHWENVDLKYHIENMFNIPVQVENEANAGAYGERIFGKGKDSKNMIYLSVGIGIGSGLIVNDRIYKGQEGFSGEFGHMSIETNGPKCTCGNKGCWELFASEQALVKKAEQVFSEKNSLGDLVIKASNNNPSAINIFHEVGGYLGQGIINMVNIFNPELIVIGNRITKAQKWIENPLKQVISSRALPYHRENLSVEFSDLNSTGIALGASYLMIEVFLKRVV
ncbi:ROK family protein [Salipaludibacillus sp. HK11]|uniref:ROK family protein n=1 Tax=Salipaludibacillus sp. HK11 TaxID=3394320 RepID=UPI0039FD49D5